ncbi:glycoside hydrolase family 2 protein [Sinomicrobium soli]|uniref:glycoside hydrolase family 2 protein n=1 Tax=Sinomicrobium sp. N-1-3-6 TaxID=2219864 RepID=UPI000DCD1139|nr:sugar-binding domain-containing protein [Sinomicrobium sp. N-1-3-6]RAV27530.1 beta-galactosidase [Sinomicrobium sp. N-1-3-6]
MKRPVQSLFLISLLSLTALYAQEIKKTAIQTPWAEEVTAENVWKEYPRPQLERKDWLNLNGHWDYAILDKDAPRPGNYQGKILVPFCVESELSGVQKKVLPEQQVWYRTSFTLPSSWSGKHILLHFGAADWETRLWINGEYAGSHKGGSNPFSFDITPFLNGKEQEITLSVWDPTDTESQARGKQVLNPKGIWYTAVTGIWQTVWLEPVEKTYIADIYPVADIDREKVVIKNHIKNASEHTTLSVKVKSKGRVITEKSVNANSDLEIPVKNPELWSPDHPFLYQLEISLFEGKEKRDEVRSYFAMRKISREKDALGYERLFLNNAPLFQYGTLDQGWWPGGLLTPPSDEAMRYDMDMLKKMGFNMLRKHIKAEPARYYYYADKAGILVWQDMVTGFETARSKEQHIRPEAEKDWERPKSSADQFEKEWKAIIDHLRFFPSIVTWVPFNEGWGQYDTGRIVKWTQEYDPTRLVDGVSGWTDRGVGDMNDAHQYPGPGMEPAELNPGRAIVLGEFGGLGLPVKGHIWNPEMRNWGYRTYHSTEKLEQQYTELIHNMAPMINKGLAAAIYTQTTDVEGEVNGLMTYDRKVVKIKPEKLNKLHALLYRHPLRATEILPDSEVRPQTVGVSYRNPLRGNAAVKELFTEKQGPVTVKKGEEAWFLKTFELQEIPRNLQLRIYATGDIKVLLNGKPVVEKFLRTKRHYDEINLNHHISALQKGNNEIVVITGNVKNDMETDFGLYTYPDK